MKKQLAEAGQNFKDLEKMASEVPIGSEGVTILPFGNGAERVFENKNLGAHILGLEFNRHSRSHLYRASLEGIAFSFVYGLNLFKQMEIPINVLRVGNDNMFQSTIFAQTIASLVNCTIEVVNTTGAYGAARAAGVGKGIYTNLEKAFQNVTPDRIYEPDIEISAYELAYSQWLTYLEKFN
jgi:xylulokinase